MIFIVRFITAPKEGSLIPGQGTVEIEAHNAILHYRDLVLLDEKEIAIKIFAQGYWITCERKA